MKNNIAVEMKNISKSFGSVIANKNINFDVKNGEVHALLGENGAGKSTLMNMLSGLYSPDNGSIFIHGNKVNIISPKDAIKKGIGMIHQHYKLVEVMTAKENIFLGNGKKIFLNKHKLNKELDTISQQYGLAINGDKKVYEMSISEKQTLEIIKVLYRGADILILDEPTAVLTPQETKNLFKIINNMKNQGCAIIIITHKLNEVMEISDKVTILRRGKTVSTVNTKETTPKELTDLMVGKSVDLKIKREEVNKSQTTLELKNVTTRDKDGVKTLDGISFNLCGGEILGVAGVAGSGQKELCEAIAGLIKVNEGSIVYEGEEITSKNPREIIQKGISMSFIPEDRLGMGLVGSMDMVDNFLLKDYYLQTSRFIKRKHIKEKCLETIKRLSIKTPGIHTPISQLSGGNIQKVLLGREIDMNPHIIITAYPVRGLDIGSSHVIYDLINGQKRRGVGILFVGEDLDVLIELCDRIMVLCDGKITGIVDATSTSKEEIGLLMAGGVERKVS